MASQSDRPIGDPGEEEDGTDKPSKSCGDENKAEALTDGTDKTSKSCKVKFDIQYIEEVKEDIELVKKRKPTRNRPINPYKDRFAHIEVTEEKGFGQILLIAEDAYFKLCFDDIQSILSRYKDDDQGREYDRHLQESVRGIQDTQGGSVCLFYEEWKYNYLQKSTDEISKLEISLKVSVKMKGENTLLIVGNDQTNVLQAATVFQRMSKRLLQLTPKADELYIWRFAFTSSAISHQIHESLRKLDGKPDFFAETIVVFFKSDDANQSEEHIRKLILADCIGIQSHSFKFMKGAKDDIEQDIEYLKTRKATALRPENPFNLRKAEVYITSSNRLVLIAMTKFFKMCQDDVILIIERYDKESTNELRSCSDEVQLNESKAGNVHQRGNNSKPMKPTQKRDFLSIAHLTSVNINIEKWKFQCFCNENGFKDYIERTFDVTLQMESETTLCIVGKDDTSVHQARRDIMTVMKQFVLETYPIRQHHYEHVVAYLDGGRCEMFEETHNVGLEIGSIVDSEEDVLSQVEDVYLILTHTLHIETLLTIELGTSGKGVTLIADRLEFSGRNSSSDLVDHIMKNWLKTGIVLCLNGYEEQSYNLESVVLDFLACLLEKRRRGLTYTLYLFTNRYQLYSRMKSLLLNVSETIKRMNQIDCYNKEEGAHRVKDTQKVLKDALLELSENTDTLEDAPEYCVAISGNRENVSKAMALLEAELLHLEKVSMTSETSLQSDTDAYDENPYIKEEDKGKLALTGRKDNDEVDGKKKDTTESVNLDISPVDLHSQVEGASQIGKIIVLEVVRGELAKQKVDVIVNSSNENLDLTQGNISKSLLKEAGWHMQNEINGRYTKPIQVAQIAVTKGYGLAAKHVLHSCLCAWNFHSSEGQVLAKQVLRRFVNNCLKTTEKLKHKSIAFPALGTGVLKYPPEVVAEEMVNTVHEYNKGHPNTCIEKVLFVIYVADKRLFQVFLDILHKSVNPTSKKAK